MNSKLNILIASIFLTVSHHALADFNFPGNGSITYPTGVEKSFEFGFAWQQKFKKFTIGSKSYEMDQIPSSYSVAITLAKDGSQVWVQEFNNGFIEAFDWTIGKHTITLKKQQFSDQVKGNYLIELDGRSYFFARNNASIVMKFDEDGIKTIAIDGVKKNMGTKN